MCPVVVPPAMDPERWRRAFTIFHDAIARDPGEREAFLSAASEGDEPIRQAAEELVSAHESAGDFLEVPAIRFRTSEVSPQRSRLIRF